MKVLDLDLSGAPRPVVTASLDPRLFARVYGGDPGEAWANWRRAAAAAACGIVIDNPLDAAPPLWRKDGAHDVPVKDVPASTLSDLSAGAGPAPGPYRLPVPEDVLQALCAEGEDHSAARETAQNALREVGALLARHGLGGVFYIVSRPLPAGEARLLAEAATAAGMRLLLPMLPDPAITSPGILWCARLAEMARARPTVAEGQKLWAFIDATPGFPSQVLGRPGHELRALGVLAWGLGVHGIRLSGLFNAVPALAGGRPDDPLTWSDALPDGSRFLANGAGYLFLPPPAGTPNTPAPTLRAALIREAIDDWRCLELLARLLAERPEARDDGAQEEARACLAWARGLDAAPSAGELSAWRARIMDALDHLQDAAPHAR